MSDPISVRHVIASGDYSERIQKAEAVQDQSIREHFAKELEKQEDLKRTQVNESEESDEVKISDEEEEKKRRKEEAEKRRQDAKAEEEASEPPTEELEEEQEHIIDLRV